MFGQKNNVGQKVFCTNKKTSLFGQIAINIFLFHTVLVFPQHAVHGDIGGLNDIQVIAEYLKFRNPNHHHNTLRERERERERERYL